MYVAIPQPGGMYTYAKYTPYKCSGLYTKVGYSFKNSWPRIDDMDFEFDANHTSLVQA